MSKKSLRKQKSRFTVLSIVICDDARQENNGKWILIGVYDTDVVVPTFPTVIPKLVIRVVFRIDVPDPKEMVFKLVPNDGSDKAKSTASLSEGGEGSIVALAFEIRNIKLSDEETIKIFLGIDEEAKQVGSFNVVRPPKMEALK